MNHSGKEPIEPEKVLDDDVIGAIMRIYGLLLQYGISLYEPDGTANGVGLESLELLLEYFERRNAPGRSQFIRNLIVEYKKRWPYRQSNYSLN